MGNTKSMVLAVLSVVVLTGFLAGCVSTGSPGAYQSAPPPQQQPLSPQNGPVVLAMNDDNLNKNELGLTAPEVKQMAQQLLNGMATKE